MRTRKGQKLATAVIVAALAGCSGGGGGSQYTYQSNPCVTSRMANGDWQQQGFARQIPLGAAAMWCAYGASFDDIRDEASGVGPNTSGWNWHGPIPDAPSVTPVAPGPGEGAATPAQPTASSAATPPQSPVTSAALPSWTPSPDPYSTGCPTSSQLLEAWNAASASARNSWTGLTPTGFIGTECWHQWVVTNPVIQANGSVVFTDTGGRLSLLPETDLSELDAAICGVQGAPTVSWAGPGGPASCSQSS